MKIKDARDLPEWFDLEKYRECDDFGPVEWYACIRARVRVAHVVRYLVPGEPSSVGNTLIAMRARPLDAAKRKGGLIEELAARPAVRSATWKALERSARLDQFLNNEQSAAWKALGISTEPEAEEVSSATGALMIPGWLDSESDAAVAVVDLGATDALLVTAFKAWLAQIRAKTPPLAATRNRPAISRWASYRVLPYIDLKIWSLQTGIEIPEPVMADAIQPGKVDIDWIGDTLAPIVRALMADLSPLRALAAENIEASERRRDA